MAIKRFGENETYQFYENEEGKRIKTNEHTIDKLWKQWIMAPLAKQYTDENDSSITIFESPCKPLIL